MKIIDPDEFNKLKLPHEVSDQVIEACRCIFILGMPLNSAAKSCGVTNPTNMIDLFNAMEQIIAQISD